MAEEKNDGAKKRFFSLDNLLTCVSLCIGGWVLALGLLEDVKNGGDRLWQMLLLGAGGAMIVWGMYRGYRFGQLLKSARAAPPAATVPESTDSILVGTNHMMNEKSKTVWQREIISNFGFVGFGLLLFAGAYLLMFFYKDTSLDNRTEVLATALAYLVVFNVMIFFRLLRKSYRR